MCLVHLFVSTRVEVGDERVADRSVETDEHPDTDGDSVENLPLNGRRACQVDKLEDEKHDRADPANERNPKRDGGSHVHRALGVKRVAHLVENDRADRREPNPSDPCVERRGQRRHDRDARYGVEKFVQCIASQTNRHENVTDRLEATDEPVGQRKETALVTSHALSHCFVLVGRHHHANTVHAEIKEAGKCQQADRETGKDDGDKRVGGSKDKLNGRRGRGG